MATRKLFQCTNPNCRDKAGRPARFFATQPVCQSCGIDASSEKFGHLIQRCVIVHFDPPTQVPGIGLNVRACDPNTIIQAAEGPNGIPNPWHAGTGTVSAVTCEACMQTAAFKAAKAAEDEDSPTVTTAAFARLNANAKPAA